MWRSAKITLKITTSQVKKPEELDTKNNDKTLFFEDYEKLDPEDKQKYEILYYYKHKTFDTIKVEKYNELSSNEKKSYRPLTYKLKEEYKDVQGVVEEEKFQKFQGFKEDGKGTVNGKEVPLYINVNETRQRFKNKKWYYDETDQQMKFYDKEYEKTKRRKAKKFFLLSVR